MKTKWIEVAIIVILLAMISICFASWDNTKPKDDDAIYTWPTSIRANWDALEVIFGTDLTGFSSQANVKTFGAIGNGTADDTTAIQDAIDSLTSGGTVFLPQGTYKITDTLVIVVEGVHIKGAGSLVSYIDKANTGTVLRINNENHYVLEDISIQGNSTAGIGIDIYKSNYGTINRVLVEGCSEGIRLTGAYLTTVSNCDLRGNTTGFNVMEDVDAIQNNIINFIGVRSWGNTGWGGIVNGGLGINFIGCLFDTNAGGGLKLGSVAAAGDNLVCVKITHCYFENNTGKQLLIGDSSIVSNVIQDTKINNNSFLINSTMISIYVDKASNTRIADNTYRHGTGTINHIEVTSNATATTIRESNPSFWSANFVDSGTNTIIIEDGTGVGVWAIRGTNPVLGIQGIDATGTNYIRMYTSAGTVIGEIRQVYAGGIPKMVFNAAHSAGLFGFEINGTERTGIEANGSYFSYTLGSNSMTWAAAAPSDGTWVQGDICWKTGAAAGGSPGWVCTTGGTPGTWKAMANVGA